jgi:hypothetical protein
MTPNQDTMFVLDRLIEWHTNGGITAPPAELEATVRLAKYLVADMRHEEETLNRWADEMQNRYDLEYTTPF